MIEIICLCLLGFLIILILFYPRIEYKIKRHRRIAYMKKGDKIVTMDGIIGTLHGIINTREISLEIYENVRIRVMRDAIANVSKKETNSKGSSFSVR